MKRKLLSVILCGTMALTMLAGCGSSQEQESEKSKNAANDQSSSSDISGELNIVHFLSEPQKVAALDEMVAGFEEEYPNVKVNQESTTLENYQDVLKLKFSTGDVPDVVFGAPKTYSTFVESGNIEDITDESYVSRVQENTLQNVKIDGKVYGIPLDVMANAVLYNKDIFDKVGIEVPKTYSEFIDCCKKLKRCRIYSMCSRISGWNFSRRKFLYYFLWCSIF